MARKSHFSPQKGDPAPQENPQVDMQVVKTVITNYELSIALNLLNGAGIPHLVYDRGNRGYMRLYTGSSIYGADILVDAPLADQAKEVLAIMEWKE